MTTIKNILTAVGGIILLLAVFFLTKGYYNDLVEDAKEETRVERIRASTLEKVAEGHYRKRVADTLTIRDLKKVVDSLGIEIKKKPKIVERIVFKFIEVEKPVDGFVVTDSTFELEDTYPDKVAPFIKYNFKYSFLTSQSQGKFTIGKIPIGIVISGERGVYQADIKAPDFIEVESIDFQGTPFEDYTPNHFGWLAGVGYYNNILEQTNSLGLSGGIRYRKLYVIGSVQTNTTVAIKSLIEF